MASGFSRKDDAGLYNRVMVAAMLVVVSAAVVTALVSRFMWWACRRSAAWGMAAGAFLAVLALGGAVVIAWLMTRAFVGE